MQRLYGGPVSIADRLVAIGVHQLRAGHWRCLHSPPNTFTGLDVSRHQIIRSAVTWAMPPTLQRGGRHSPVKSACVAGCYGALLWRDAARGAWTEGTINPVPVQMRDDSVVAAWSAAIELY